MTRLLPPLVSVEVRVRVTPDRSRKGLSATNEYVCSGKKGLTSLVPGSKRGDVTAGRRQFPSLKEPSGIRKRTQGPALSSWTSKYIGCSDKRYGRTRGIPDPRGRNHTRPSRGCSARILGYWCGLRRLDPRRLWTAPPESPLSLSSLMRQGSRSGRLLGSLQGPKGPVRRPWLLPWRRAGDGAAGWSSLQFRSLLRVPTHDPVGSRRRPKKPCSSEGRGCGRKTPRVPGEGWRRRAPDVLVDNGTTARRDARSLGRGGGGGGVRFFGSRPRVRPGPVAVGRVRGVCDVYTLPVGACDVWPCECPCEYANGGVGGWVCVCVLCCVCVCDVCGPWHTWWSTVFVGVWGVRGLVVGSGCDVCDVGTCAVYCVRGVCG